MTMEKNSDAEKQLGMPNEIITKETVPRKITELDKERQRTLHNKYRSQYRYICACCNYRTYYNHVIANHVQSEKHVLLRELKKQEYDYIKYETPIPLGQEPTEEGQRVKIYNSDRV